MNCAFVKYRIEKNVKSMAMFRSRLFEFETDDSEMKEFSTESFIKNKNILLDRYYSSFRSMKRMPLTERLIIYDDKSNLIEQVALL